ncbi:putative Single-stranded nucleic acid binding R3H [Cocos nucifera]|nr:putative Single-stranded nucleic acid binding R3H [Cocos nucifera]
MQISSPPRPLEEREAAYQAARERIFALNDSGEKDVLVPKSRRVPVVARRMIAHALGQKICSTPSNQKTSSHKFEENESTEGPTNDERNEDKLDRTLEYSKEATAFPDRKLCMFGRKMYDKPANKSSNYSCSTSIEMKGHNKAVGSGSPNSNSLPNTGDGRVVDAGNLEKERIDAAKRIFAHALGLPSSKGNNSLTVKSKTNGPFRRDI